MEPISLQEQVSRLHAQQLSHWQLAQENYQALSQVVETTMACGNYLYRLQYNPRRIQSTTAQLSQEALAQRPCFLCAANRPPQQQAIPLQYSHSYQLLLNPYPIFPQHLSLVASEHCRQELTNRFTDMLQLAKDLPNYTILYNGAEAGASAPDHFHFQAAGKASLPIEQETRVPAKQREVVSSPLGRVFELVGRVPRVVVLQSKQQAFLVDRWLQLMQLLAKQQDRVGEEPRINAIADYTEGEWTVCIFPRRAHRPQQYYRQGAEQVLFSPGVVDMGGLLIFPRQEDYAKLQPELLQDMLSQVSYTGKDWEYLIQELKKAYEQT